MERADEPSSLRHLRALCGVGDPAIAELLAYLAPGYRIDGSIPRTFPLPDEPHVQAWRSYAEECRRDSVVATLGRHLVQFRFPIQAGISTTDAYIAATRRGEQVQSDEARLAFVSPDTIQLEVRETCAGAVPILTAGDRRDFITLVQALTARNEPVSVPDGMGACLVKGLNNWSRIAALRRQWAAETTDASDEAWAGEFQRIIPHKERYQDRLVLLSRGPYSATSAAKAGWNEDAWLEVSLQIRREHELTHYLTYRVFGHIRNHAVDELLADFVGLLKALGRYDGSLARCFLGLEAFPRYRSGGRLEHYTGDPPCSEEAFLGLQRLVVKAIEQLEIVATRAPTLTSDAGTLGRFVLEAVTMPLDALASGSLVDARLDHP